MILIVIRMLLIGIGVALVASVIALLILPNSTKIEEGLLIIMITFAASAVIAVVVQILLRRRNCPLDS
jgi:hypothetical protein